MLTKSSRLAAISGSIISELIGSELMCMTAIADFSRLIREISI